MNLRQYKKMAKRYRDMLIAEGHARAEHFWYPAKEDEECICPGVSVTGCDPVWGVTVKPGTPLFLPERTDYWGEALDPDCPIRVHQEITWWGVCGDSYIRKELAAEAD